MDKATSRLPALDGLRTFALLAVVLWHEGSYLSPRLRDLIPGGQIGVDVFFVLSGFVVTRLLVLEHDRLGRFQLGAFYLRRLERLMPALVAFTVLITAVILVSPMFRHEAKYAVAALTYTMDLVRAAAPEGNGKSVIYGQTWSLGVEMQFYLLWPPVLILLLRLGRLRALLVTVALAMLSVVDAVALVVHNPANSGRVYNAPDTRAVQLLLGCAAALLLSLPAGASRHRAVQALRVLAWPAAAVLVVLVICREEQRLFAERPVTGLPGEIALIAVAGAVLIGALAESGGHPIARLLGTSWLAQFGARFSYSLYLWHLPVIVLTAAYGRGPAALRIVISLALSLLLAYLSAVYVEAPWNARKGRLQKVAL